MQDLISLLQKGDEQAFTAIFNTYWQQMFAAAYRRVSDEQVAQDITQNIFLQLWERRDTLSLRQETLEFYLLKSVKNKVINHFTSSQVKRAVLEKLARQFENIASRPYILREHEKLESHIDACIDQLPEQMRTIFIMRSNRLSIKQIAENLNIAEQTVKNNITKALRLLRESLHKNPIDEDLMLLFATVLLTGAGSLTIS
ncbi:RNA polymerase sigma-70 factor [Chitinophaga alhagiae]|uniref:RNA polymerase sigma-70 factor n=1 Tax=Chitinophaga alhagiae TaxID=2203219 RepID=UPI001300B671|nr:RNA polymerase sigma-70 factor [Chitinophaga alhagiae]